MGLSFNPKYLNHWICVLVWSSLTISLCMESFDLLVHFHRAKFISFLSFIFCFFFFYLKIKRNFYFGLNRYFSLLRLNCFIDFNRCFCNIQSWFFDLNLFLYCFWYCYFLQFFQNLNFILMILIFNLLNGY